MAFYLQINLPQKSPIPTLFRFINKTVCFKKLTHKNIFSLIILFYFVHQRPLLQRFTSDELEEVTSVAELDN